MPGGRPKFEINYGQVEAMSSVMATQEEIATFLGCDVRTLQRDAEFCRIYKKGQEEGKMSLRRRQFELAKKSASMAIFLGKNYLGQKDVVEQDHNLQNGVIDELIGALNNAKNT